MPTYILRDGLSERRFTASDDATALADCQLSADSPPGQRSALWRLDEGGNGTPVDAEARRRGALHVVVAGQ